MSKKENLTFVQQISLLEKQKELKESDVLLLDKQKELKESDILLEVAKNTSAGEAAKKGGEAGIAAAKAGERRAEVEHDLVRMITAKKNDGQILLELAKNTSACEAAKAACEAAKAVCEAAKAACEAAKAAAEVGAAAAKAVKRRVEVECDLIQMITAKKKKTSAVPGAFSFGSFQVG